MAGYSPDERNNEDNLAPMEDTTYCRCCGGKAEMDAFCLQCHHQYNEWCAQGDGKCINCGCMVDDEGKCTRCNYIRTRDDGPTVRPTHCTYCGFLLDVDGSCIRSKSHGQVTAG